MRRAEDPIDPGVAAALMAIDATLDGDPIDPDYAELAELALILRSERPVIADDFAAAMDTRVDRRFARPAPSPQGGRRRRTWRWLPAGGAVAVAGVALVVGISSLGSGSSLQALNGASSGSQEFSSSSSSAATSSAASAAAAGGTTTVAAGTSSSSGSAASGSAGAGGAGAGAGTASTPSGKVIGGTPRIATPALGPAPHRAAAPPRTTVLSPPLYGPARNRQVIQSAQLSLAAAPTRIDEVAQQVFGVVQANDGIVASSNVTAGAGGGSGIRTPVEPIPPFPGSYAQFQLSIPSANLPTALAALSQMRYARVLSRTDTTSDITGQVGGAGMRLAEARALRRSLLKQLAAATTTQQVESLKIQIRDADAAIAAYLSQLTSLKRRVAYSHVTVTIQGITPPPASSGGSFTIGKGAHDAARVLVVAAGVALIALAALVPVALVGALLAWIGFTLRRRRREHALDLV